MKQAITTSSGVFLAISIVSLIVGGLCFAGKTSFENEVKNRDVITGTLGKELGLDKIRLEQFQGYINSALIVAGGSGALAVGLAVAGKDKVKE
jgi:hypothetical protein